MVCVCAFLFCLTVVLIPYVRSDGVDPLQFDVSAPQCLRHENRGVAGWKWSVRGDFPCPDSQFENVGLSLLLFLLLLLLLLLPEIPVA